MPSSTRYRSTVANSWRQFRSTRRVELLQFENRPLAQLLYEGEHGVVGHGPEPFCFVNQQLALHRKCPLWVSSRLSRERSVSPLSAN